MVGTQQMLTNAFMIIICHQILDPINFEIHHYFMYH